MIQKLRVVELNGLHRGLDAMVTSSSDYEVTYLTRIESVWHNSDAPYTTAVLSRGMNWRYFQWNDAVELVMPDE